MKLPTNALLDSLRALDLPERDYAIFGSGPMFAHGLKALDHDIDIVARGEAWERALKMGRIIRNVIPGHDAVEFLDGSIEITNYWFDDLQPGVWNVDELIDSAETIDGLRYVTLENVAVTRSRSYGGDECKN